MKKKMFRFVFILIAICLGFISCEKEDLSVQENLQTNEVEIAAQVQLPDAIAMPEIFEFKIPETDAKWGWTPHEMTMWIAAKQWGISDSRANTMKGAAHMPDVYDNEGTIPGTQQWRHGYIYLYGVYTGIGIADAMCANNISGSGLNGKSAFYYYPGDKFLGDWYLGYASHYLQDVANCWHTSANAYQQIDTHGPYETWVNNNWTAGHNFQAVINSDYYYYSVSNPAATVRALALWSNGKNTTIYNAYVNSGKPTGAGTGNATLISETKELLKASGRYTKGLIKYTLNAEGAW